MAFRSYEDHMADLLVVAGLSMFDPDVKADWSITIGKMLDSPERIVTIYQTGGLAKNPAWLIDYPSIQIKVRGGANDYQATREKAEYMANFMVGRESYTAANGDRIVHINAIGDVGFTGWDDSKRPEFSFNLRLIAEPDPNNVLGTDRRPL